MNEKISIVIPCYNVGFYINKCLESILSQTYPNLEVIVVNDGSTDDTEELINRFMSDNRIKYINQTNAGVSSARNIGIDSATGDLLAFVDSDDFLETDMYEKLYKALTETNADMAVCNFNHVYDNKIDKKYSKMRKQVINIQDDIYSYFARFCACPDPNNYIWTRLYKTEIVKKSGVRFENYKLGDDTLFNFKLLPHMNTVSFTPEGLYNYYQRSSSNIYTVANKVNLAVIYADTFDSLVEYYNANNFMEFLEILPIHSYTRLRSIFFYSRLAGMSDEAIADNIKVGFENRKIAEYLTGKRN